ANEVRSSAELQGRRSRRRRLKQKKKERRDRDRDRDHHHHHQQQQQSVAADGVWCGPRVSDDSADCVIRHHHGMMMMMSGGPGRRQDSERIHREVMVFQTRMVSGRMNVYDRYRDWRLDVDRMSYEELLELGDRIGYVNTGLREEEISRSLRKMKHSILDASPLYFSSEMEKKCSICQEEYEDNDEMGKLECGHRYHVYCIKQWLLQKNSCPICKTAVTKT
ncbi:E3 ubiquitin-protein ligase MBR2-like, partial [Asparagus officinalis]